MKQNIKPSTKVGIKRKIELTGPFANKINVVRKPKALLKADLVVKLKELQEQFDDLKKENEQTKESLQVQEATNSKNLQIIKQLKDKVELLETEKAPSLTTGVTTNLKCEQYDFETRDRIELSWHLNESHGWPLDRDPKDLDMSQGIRYCSKCDYEAEDGYDMDGHKWGEHDDEDLESLSVNIVIAPSQL